MIHFKLTRKNVRRLCVMMALIAPIVYLFGSLFTGLNGAHGAFPFSADYEIVTDSEVVEFSQLYEASPVGSYDVVPVNSYTADVFNYVAGVYVPLFRIQPEFPTVYYYHIKTDVSYLRTASSGGFPYIDAPDLFAGYSGFVTIDNVSRSAVNITGTSNSPSVERSVVQLNLIDVSAIYGYGNEPTLSEFLDDFPLPWYDYAVDEKVVLSSESVPSNAQFVFNQFFPKDNFVELIGEDAISETPHGFAPFGALFRYIDDNAFHMAGTQVGLMAYGYLYWCAHVLLFDVLFMMTTFFISFIERVGDRLGGNE